MLRAPATKTNLKYRLQLPIPRALCLLALAGLVFLGLGLDLREVSACERARASQPDLDRVRAATTRAPQIVHSGFRAPPPATDRPDQELTHLWLQLAEVPADADFVVLEPVWGSGPAALSGMWSRAIPIRSKHVFVYPSWQGPHRDQAFTLGYRLRFVFADGSIGPPSLPTFVSHSGQARSEGGAPSHQVLLLLCFSALLGLWIVFRRDPDPVHRIRVAAAVGLVSILFLATTPALSWVSVEDPSGRLATIDCQLGDEAQCATYVPDSGPNPLSVSDTADERRFELARWMSAASALRIGLILCLILLMPALIWLLVAPTLRPAQSAMVFGASAAGYTFLAALCYRLTVPSWMVVESSHALGLTILTAANIVIAAGMVVYWSFRHLSQDEINLPEARARLVKTP
jgi:hypothetical protein